MDNIFWAKRVEPGKTCPVRIDGILRIQQACLPENPKEGKTVLKVLVNGTNFVLCTLTKNRVESQKLSHIFTPSDQAKLSVEGANGVDVTGYFDFMPVSEEEEDEEEEEEETVTGQPTYMNYLSDLLGPDLADDDDDDYEDEMDPSQDDYGTLAFRDPTDNDLLGGFELRHFNLVPNAPGFDKVDLRAEEQDIEETLLK
ncbi:hypothetical protein EDC96DRAFT_576870 [Choanephora cucurbitarum]|nr:hypothetical protein EDC96DRAFT_576870 [Choanephora cucurbitarum]